jgi:hypothetical protein
MREKVCSARRDGERALASEDEQTHKIDDANHLHQREPEAAAIGGGTI